MPRKRPSALQQDRNVCFIRETMERLEAPGKRSNSTPHTFLDDLLALADYSPTPDGFRSSSGAQGVVLTYPASQAGLRTDPEDAKPPPHEKGYSEDTSVEAMAQARMDAVCPRCDGSGIDPIPGREDRPRDCRHCEGTGNRYADPITEAVQVIVEVLDKMRPLAVIIDRKLAVIQHAGDTVRERVPTLAADCSVCRKARATRGGMCPDCYLAFDSWKLAQPLSDDPATDRRRFTDFVKDQPEDWKRLDDEREREMDEPRFGDAPASIGWDPAIHSSIGPADGEDRRAQ